MASLHSKVVADTAADAVAKGFKRVLGNRWQFIRYELPEMLKREGKKDG